ncbi:MAG: hypothetical protein N3A66_06280, partial [Planctomycetota bacterium]|nr:hypothetical protein [Planctomycetota bacterium]
VYAAYDEENIYLAAAVDEESFSNKAGPLVYKKRGDSPGLDLPYRTGWPDGLTHIRYCGDAFWLSFGFRERVPGWGRQMDDPWAWKGHFYDSDDHFVAHASTEGDMLVRQWSAESERRTGYQTVALPYVCFMKNGKAVIRREEEQKRTVYTIAIPRRELKLFDPNRGRCRFAFAFTEDKPVRPGLMLHYQDTRLLRCPFHNSTGDGTNPLRSYVWNLHYNIPPSWACPHSGAHGFQSCPAQNIRFERVQIGHRIWTLKINRPEPAAVPMLFDFFRYDADRVFWLNGWHGGQWIDWAGPCNIFSSQNGRTRHLRSFGAMFFDMRATLIREPFKHPDGSILIDWIGFGDWYFLYTSL